jgi:hypothetical protein
MVLKYKTHRRYYQGEPNIYKPIDNFLRSRRCGPPFTQMRTSVHADADQRLPRAGFFLLTSPAYRHILNTSCFNKGATA